MMEETSSVRNLDKTSRRLGHNAGITSAICLCSRAFPTDLMSKVWLQNCSKYSNDSANKTWRNPATLLILQILPRSLLYGFGISSGQDNEIHWTNSTTSFPFEDVMVSDKFFLRYNICQEIADPDINKTHYVLACLVHVDVQLHLWRARLSCHQIQCT